MTQCLFDVLNCIRTVSVSILGSRRANAMALVSVVRQLSQKPSIELKSNFMERYLFRQFFRFSKLLDFQNK